MSMYTNGEYLAEHPNWHQEDSAWKAEQIRRMIKKHGIAAQTIAEIGCGAGEVLAELQRTSDCCQDANFLGFDISPQAIEIAKRKESERIRFSQQDILHDPRARFDLLLVIDVFEHVPDYLGFIEKCAEKAKYKIYHVPLDLHVSSLLRNRFIRTRQELGHLHYFTADSALATIRDTNQEVIDYAYTNAAFDLFFKHPSLRKAVANIPRWLVSRISESLAARLFGGYSLLVLTE